MKLNQRFGEERMTELNRLLIKSLVKTQLDQATPAFASIRSTLEARIAYPSDIGVLHQAVRTLTRTASPSGQNR